ncbi:MAG TPA: hypothetical protein DIW07_12065 [Lachnospiraceae bacterium]|nr:hypothetical protein [Lachnospiraceae bacterium]
MVQLDSDTEVLLTTARNHLCQFSPLTLNVSCDGIPCGKQKGIARNKKALKSAYIAVQERLFLVPEVGLEPTRLAAHDFESLDITGSIGNATYSTGILRPSKTLCNAGL